MKTSRYEVFKTNGVQVASVALITQDYIEENDETGLISYEVENLLKKLYPEDQGYDVMGSMEEEMVSI